MPWLGRRRRCVAVFATLVIAAALSSSSAHAARAEELVAIHVEAIGGRARIAALHAVRANGEVIAGNKRMRFTMTAARPASVRLETDEGGRTLVQVTDGRHPPWEFDTGHWPPQYRDMPATSARTFAEDAEFDDPIVGGAARGFTIEYAGETAMDGRKYLRLLVTRRLTQTFALLLDNETFLIAQRIEEKKNPLGGTAHLVTLFDDYRPVDGVLMPHRIAFFVDGRPKQQTVIDSVEANPELGEDTFVRPTKISVPTKDGS